MSFFPVYAGLQRGAVELIASNGNALAIAYVSGVGIGPQVGFLPRQAAQVGGYVSYSYGGLAVDGKRNLFFSDNGLAASYQGSVFEALAADAYQTIIAVAPGYPNGPLTVGLNQPGGIALDAAGDIFVADTGNNAVKEIVAVNGAIPASNATIVTLGSGFNYPYGVAVDGAGNVFVADTGNNAVKEIMAAGNYTSVVTLAPGYNGANATTGFAAPKGLTLDGAANVFVADTNNGAVKEIVAAGGYSSVVSIAATSLASVQHGNPVSIAVDVAGDLFVGFSGYPSDSLELEAVNGSVQANAVITYLTYQLIVATDEAGDVYAAEPTSGSSAYVVALSTAPPPALQFAATQVGATSTDSPQTVGIANLGNAPLSFSIPTSGTNPSVSAGFRLGSGTCPLLTTASGSPALLVEGATCAIDVEFVPVVAGAASGTLVFTDNADPATQTIELSGVGTTVSGPATHFSIAVPANAVAGSAFAVTVTALDASGTAVTGYSGTVHFTSNDGAATLPPNGLLLGGTATFEVTLKTPGSRTLSVADTANDSLASTSSVIAVALPSFIVTTTADASSGVAANCPSASNCSLRDALTAAASVGGTITFDPVVFASAQTITVNANFGSLVVPSNTSILGATSGSGAGLRNLVSVSGSYYSSVSIVSIGRDVTGVVFKNLIFSNGTNSTGGTGLLGGGALYNQGSATVLSSTFIKNTAFNGGAIYTTGGLAISGSTFSANSATGDGSTVEYGAAIYNSGTLTVNASTFSGNYATSADSAIYSTGPVVITDSTLEGYGAPPTVLIGGTGEVTASNSILGSATSLGCAGNGCPVSGVAGNLVNSALYLSALGNFGGPTQTILVGPAEGATCAGSSAFVPAGTLTDQRGLDRTTVYAGVPCVDAGAVQGHYDVTFTRQPPSVVDSGVGFPESVLLTESGSPAVGFPVPVSLEGSILGATSSGDQSDNALVTDATGTVSYTQVVSGAAAESNLLLVALAGSPLATSSTPFDLSLAAPVNPPPPIYPNFIITTISDASSGVAANCPSASNCSFRDALAAAGAAGGGNITFDPTVFAYATTLLYTSANLAWLVPANTTVTGRTSGSGATLTNLVTLSGGGNGSPSGILVILGDGVTLSQLNFIDGVSYAGGAISDESYGALTVTECNFAGNSATSDGGGAISIYGPLTVSESYFANNTATYPGGGAIVAGDIVTITDTTFASNSVTNFPAVMYGSGGGAVYASAMAAQPVLFNNDTFIGNTISGIASTYTGGGAIFSSTSTIVANSTFSGNSAFAGANSTNGNGASIAHFSVNGGSFLSVTNSIFSGDLGGECINGGVVCTPTATAGNVLDSTGAAVLLLPLTNYGGPVPTMLPQPGSTAVCAGVLSEIVPNTTTDERGAGFSRTTNYSSGACVDSGALQTHYALTFTQDPASSQISGQAFPVILSLAESGNAIGGATIAVALTPVSPGVQLFGGPLVTGANGVASGTLTVTTASSVSGISIQAGSSAQVSATSTHFSVTPAALAVTAVSPLSGYVAGGVSVVLSGSGFTGATSVKFGATPAIAFTVNSANQITATVPAASAAGAVSITVVTPSGTTLASQAAVFTYIAEPTTLSFTVNPGVTFGYAQQPSVSFALNASVPNTVSSSNFMATLDGTTALTLSAGSVGGYNVALPAAPLLVGTHAIVVQFSGSQDLAPTAQTLTLTVLAPTITVTSVSDPVTGSATNCPNASQCSLRDALAAAAQYGGGNIVFDSHVFAGAQTIQLSSTLTPASNTAITGPSAGTGLGSLNPLTIAGGGSASDFAIFSVSGANVSISDLVAANGNTQNHQITSSGGLYNTGSVTLNGMTFINNTSANSGGAIVNDGSLTITNSTFVGNSVSFGAGGAIYNAGTYLSVNNSTFTGNTAQYAGAIVSYNPVILDHNTFSQNHATIEQGALGVALGNATVTNSLFSGDTGMGYTALGYMQVPDECTGGGCVETGVDGNVLDLGGVTAQLAPLGMYGGRTQTFLPAPGSSAICAATSNSTTPTDQRGVGRPAYGSSCYDAGAVQTDYALSFSTQPSNVTQTAVMFPSPAVQVTEAGLPFEAVPASISLVLSNGAGSLNVSAAFTSTASGIASFTPLTVSQAGVGDVLTAGLVLNASRTLGAASAPFNVTAAALTVTGLSPSEGIVGGGTSVVVSGTGFTGTTAISFGGTAAASFTVNSATQITAVSPPGLAGSVDVKVSGASGSSPVTPKDVYTYNKVAATMLTATVSPSSTFVFGQQPTVTVALTPSNIPNVTAANITATLDGTSMLVVTPGGNNVFGIALPSISLQVGVHSIAVVFGGTAGYPASSTTVSLTVTLPSIVVTSTALMTAIGTPSNCPSATNCGLNDAIALGSAAGGAAITFDPVVFAAPVTLEVSNLSLALTSNISITGPTSGNGATLTNLVTLGGVATYAQMFYLFAGTVNSSITNLNLIAQAGDSSGAVFNAGGTLAIDHDLFYGFSANSFSAAIYSTGTVSISNSTFAKNETAAFGLEVANGGAVYNSGTMTVTNSTFTGNIASSYGGSFGGAVYNSGTLTVSDSTFSQNVLGMYTAALGAAIYSAPSATGLMVVNSVFGGDAGDLCSGTGCPVSGVNGNIVDGKGQLVNLSPLGKYGGPIPTVVPLPGSTAICGGIATSTTTDERGFARPGHDSRAACFDSGAVQTSYALAFATQPSNVAQAAIMTPAPSLLLTESGQPFTAAAIALPLTLSQGSGAIFNASAATEPSSGTGLATYNGLSFAQPGNGDILAAKLVISASITLSALSNSFNVTSVPLVVAAINPSSGPMAGGNSVILTGEGFGGVTQVLFGGTAAAFTINSATQITAIVPGSALGNVDVVVSTSGTSSPHDPGAVYTYIPNTLNLLSFTPIPNHTYGDAPFAVTASSASPGAITYSIVSGPATVSGDLVSLTGFGTVILSASQTSSGSFGAQTAQTSFAVAPQAPTLTFSPVPMHRFGDAPFAISATSNSPGIIVYSVVSGPASLSGNLVTLTGGGAVVLQATQRPADVYSGASVQIGFVVVPPIAFTWTPVSLHLLTGTPLGSGVLDAVASDPSTIAYTAALLPSGDPVSVGQATVLAAGTYTLTATATPINPANFAEVSISYTLMVSSMNIFVSNSAGTVSSLYNSGVTQSPPTAGGGIGVAVDSNGFVWSINANGAGLSRFTDTGVLAASYPGVASISGGTSLAIDGNGTVWVANSAGTVSAVANSGTAALSTPIGAAAGLNHPVSVSVDASGSLWLANGSGDSITEIVGVATPVTTPTSTAVSNATVGSRP